MKKIIVAAILAAFGVTAAVSTAWAHGGRTDKNGCHMDRKTGTRHCH